MAYDEHFRIGAQHKGSLDSLAWPWAALSHLTLLSAPVVPFAGPVVGPLAIMFTVGHREPAVFREATKALNFGITLSLVSLVVQYVGYFNGEVTSVNDTWAAQFYVFLLSVPFVVLAAWQNKKGWSSRYGLAIPWVRDPAPRREPKISRRKRRVLARRYAARAEARMREETARKASEAVVPRTRQIEQGPDV